MKFYCLLISLLTFLASATVAWAASQNDFNFPEQPIDKLKKISLSS